jgi:hypothetical protein
MAGAPKGNQNAVKAKIWSDRLKQQIEERKLWPKLADALLEKALEGDVAAIKEVGDRVEGKVAQRIEATGADGGPLTHKLVEVLIVDPKDRGSEKA